MDLQFEQVTVNLVNDKIQFTGVSEANPDSPVTFDYKPPIGDGKGYNGLELLLMSLAGCSATAVVYLLRKMRKNVTGLKVIAKGIRAAQPPIKFERIFLDFNIDSPDANEDDIQKAIQLAEESVCPVWQMIKNNVEVETTYKIFSEPVLG